MEIDIEDVVMTLALSLIVIAGVMIMYALVSNTIPHGDIMQKTGVIIDIDYDSGGYGTSASTFLQWDDGEMIRLYSVKKSFKQGVLCTLTYRKGDWYGFFENIEYKGSE